MTNIISLKPGIIAPFKNEEDIINLKENAKKYIDEVNWENIVIMGMDKDKFINHWHTGGTYEQMFYLIERHKHNLMLIIDEKNK